MKMVTELPSKGSGRSLQSERWDQVAEEVRGLPEGSWGVVEEGVPLFRSQAVRTNLAKRGTFEVTYRSGTVYAREVRS